MIYIRIERFERQVYVDKSISAYNFQFNSIIIQISHFVAAGSLYYYFFCNFTRFVIYFQRVGYIGTSPRTTIGHIIDFGCGDTIVERHLISFLINSIYRRFNEICLSFLYFKKSVCTSFHSLDALITFCTPNCTIVYREPLVYACFLIEKSVCRQVFYIRVDITLARNVRIGILTYFTKIDFARCKRTRHVTHTYRTSGRRRYADSKFCFRRKGKFYILEGYAHILTRMMVRRIIGYLKVQDITHISF